jgi:adenosine deaminase
VYTDFSQVPLPILLSAGATVALAADDPLLFRSRLVAQYEVARDVFGLSDAALADLARSSIDASLASPSRKAAWKADIDAWLAAPAA